MNDDFRNIWQNQPAEPFLAAAAELRTKAAKFQRRIARRNVREYLAAMIVIAAFTGYTIFLPGLLIKIGSAMIVVAAVFVACHLYRKGSSTPVPADMALTNGLAFHRRELERQRDLLRSVWSWYLAPFVPGLVLFEFGLAAQLPKRLPVVFQCVVNVALFAGVWWLNRRGAKKLQGEIDLLDSLERD